MAAAEARAEDETTSSTAAKMRVAKEAEVRAAKEAVRVTAAAGTSAATTLGGTGATAALALALHEKEAAAGFSNWANEAESEQSPGEVRHCGGPSHGRPLCTDTCPTARNFRCEDGGNLANLRLQFRNDLEVHVSCNLAGCCTVSECLSCMATCCLCCCRAEASLRLLSRA